jgi:hypothetical protein
VVAVVRVEPLEMGNTLGMGTLSPYGLERRKRERGDAKERSVWQACRYRWCHLLAAANPATGRSVADRGAYGSIGSKQGARGGGEDKVPSL